MSSKKLEIPRLAVKLLARLSECEQLHESLANISFKEIALRSMESSDSEIEGIY